LNEFRDVCNDSDSQVAKELSQYIPTPSGRPRRKAANEIAAGWLTYDFKRI